jgi:ABC-type Zn uptake system ZnuABC Zn-binding protein ZnuA
MKYLIMLLLLIGCGPTPVYKKGDCVRLYTSIRVMDFFVREVFEDKYILSPAFLKKDGLYHTKSKYSYDVTYHFHDTSKKIDCRDVE